MTSKRAKGINSVCILNELAMVYKNYTREFFELQTREMPDWKKPKKKIRNNTCIKTSLASI
jgi:hypothetical protein